MPAKKEAVKFAPEPLEVKRPWYSVRREFVIALLVTVILYLVVAALV